MKSVKENKNIVINANEFKILALIKEGMLGPYKYLMNEEESEEISRTKKFKGHTFLYPLTFVCKYDKVKETLKNIKFRDKIDLILNNKIVGHIVFHSQFKYKSHFTSIFNFNECFLDDKTNVCISGEFEIYNSPIKSIKEKFLSIKNNLNAKKITAIVSSFDPLHRAHERIFRWSIDKADLVVVFLIESYEENGLDFSLKEKYLNQFIKNYLPPDRIFVFPLQDTYIFHAHLNPGLEGTIAKNLGCTKLIVGQNHTGLGMFYDCNQPKTILDEFAKDYGIEVIVLPEFVFCDKCAIIVSTKSCPHGHHHHMHFNSNSLKELLRAGIIPPAIFMRKEISSMILSKLFPNRFKNMQKIYNDLFPTNGILEYKKDEEFYQKLLEVHQMSYMV